MLDLQSSHVDPEYREGGNLHRELGKYHNRKNLGQGVETRFTMYQLCYLKQISVSCGKNVYNSKTFWDYFKG